MRITELTFYLAIQFIKKTEDNFLKLIFMMIPNEFSISKIIEKN